MEWWNKGGQRRIDKEAARVTAVQEEQKRKERKKMFNILNK